MKNLINPYLLLDIIDALYNKGFEKSWWTMSDEEILKLAEENLDEATLANCRAIPEKK